MKENKTKELSPIDSFLKSVKEEMKQKRKLMAWVEKNRARIEKIDARPSFYGGQVDYDNLPHDEIIKVIKAFGGKWQKSPNLNGGKVDYKTRYDGVTIRCWAGETPPNCKIVEEEVHVPASTQIVRRLVCPKNTL